jgi:hypothetical protein
MSNQQQEPGSTSANKRLLTVREAAIYLAVSADMLQSMRTRGGGPRFAKYGRGRTAPIRYDVRDLDRWVEEQKRISTSGTSKATEAA